MFGVARLLGDIGMLLSISQTTANTIVISWPHPSDGWTLQQNIDLATPTWITPPEPVQTGATNRFIVVNQPTERRFFRLARE